MNKKYLKYTHSCALSIPRGDAGTVACLNAADEIYIERERPQALWQCDSRSSSFSVRRRQDINSCCFCSFSETKFALPPTDHSLLLFLCKDAAFLTLLWSRSEEKWSETGKAIPCRYQDFSHKSSFFFPSSFFLLHEVFFLSLSCGSLPARRWEPYLFPGIVRIPQS